MKWSAKGWTPKRGHMKFEIDAPNNAKAMKAAKKHMKMKGSGEVTITPYNEKLAGSSVKESPKEKKTKTETAA